MLNGAASTETWFAHRQVPPTDGIRWKLQDRVVQTELLLGEVRGKSGAVRARRLAESRQSGPTSGWARGGFCPEGRPVREVSVDGFLIDRHPVTSRTSAGS